MASQDAIKDDVLQTAANLLDLIEETENVDVFSGSAFEEWKKRCKELSSLISEDVLRVAVVGAIKSGKSTFVNSLFEGDYLKMGAGVVTSIVTRVKTGHKLKAVLHFKNWDEINRDLGHAMVLLPGLDADITSNGFDIRREKDRESLKASLKTLETDQLITNDTRNANSTLLTLCLDGYDRIKDYIRPENRIVTFEKDTFEKHRAFVADDTLAVYVKDILLTIPEKGPGDGVEIADCQGSDSPNPMHLSMIQDYLLLTNFIIYVISSRTGLRQADIRFLSMIKKMGILDSTIFIINCDLSEHESMNDLKALIEKITNELSMICPAPLIFSLSSLYYLLEKMERDLSERDALKLAAWRRGNDLLMFSNSEKLRFQETFKRKLFNGRAAVLFKNAVERLDLVAFGFNSWIRRNLDLLAKDSVQAGEMSDAINVQKKQMDQMKSVIKSTLDGAVGRVQQDLKNEIDSFFDDKYGRISKETLDFIRSYTVRFDEYKDRITSSGFASALFLVFQEFRRAVDTHMTQVVNPEIIRFTKTLEQTLADYFDSVSGPFEAMIRDAITAYQERLGAPVIEFTPEDGTIDTISEIASIRAIGNLKMPPASASLRYSGYIKTDAVVRLGAYKLLRYLKTVFKKPVEREDEEKWLALKDSVKRMKHEAEKSIVATFMDYRENLKFQYILKIADGVSKSLHMRLSDRFRLHVDDLGDFAKRLGQESVDKDQLTRMLVKTAGELETSQTKIGVLREKIALLDQGV